MRLLIIAILLASSAHAELRLPSLFADGMLLQRDKPANVWGTASPGATVTVKFASQKKRAIADGQGNWQVALNPMTASSEGRKMVISEDKSSDRTVIQNILVGDVWVISGQSNMGWALSRIDSGESVQAASNSQIRYFAQAEQIASTPALDSSNGRWLVTSPKTAGEFSAVGYFMAEALQEHLDVPIGLLFAARGGAPIRCFIDRDVMMGTATRDRVEQYEANIPFFPERQREFEAKMEAFKQEVRDAKKAGKKKPQMPASLKWGVMGPGHRFQPYGLYNGMIKPLQPFTIRGFAWYQGESDANPEDAPKYAEALSALIGNWRSDWADETLPFLIV